MGNGILVGDWNKVSLEKENPQHSGYVCENIHPGIAFSEDWKAQMLIEGGMSKVWNNVAHLLCRMSCS